MGLRTVRQIYHTKRNGYVLNDTTIYDVVDSRYYSYSLSFKVISPVVQKTTQKLNARTTVWSFINVSFRKILFTNFSKCKEFVWHWPWCEHRPSIDKWRMQVLLWGTIFLIIESTGWIAHVSWPHITTACLFVKFSKIIKLEVLSHNNLH